VGTTFQNTLFKETKKERYKGWEEEKEDVSSYWMSLRKGEDAVN
jgi:hypothetical protein